jgi:hypothetical protein
MAYEIIKSPRSGYLIDDGSGTSIRYATKVIAQATIAKWDRRDAETAEWTITERAARLERVNAYLAARTLRVPVPTQLELL